MTASKSSSAIFTSVRSRTMPGVVDQDVDLAERVDRGARRSARRPRSRSPTRATGRPVRPSPRSPRRRAWPGPRPMPSPRRPTPRSFTTTDGALAGQLQGELAADPTARSRDDRHPVLQQHRCFSSRRLLRPVGRSVGMAPNGAPAGAGILMTRSSHRGVVRQKAGDPWPVQRESIRSPRPRTRRRCAQLGPGRRPPRGGAAGPTGDDTGELPPEAVKAMAAADLFRVTIGEQWGGLGLRRRRGVDRPGGDRPPRRLHRHLLPADLQRPAPGHRAPRLATR